MAALLIGIGFNKCWPINVIEVLKNSRDGANLVVHSNRVPLVIRLSAPPGRMIIVQAPTFKKYDPYKHVRTTGRVVIDWEKSGCKRFNKL